MVMLETAQRLADESLKTAYAKYYRTSNQSISNATFTAIAYTGNTTSNSDILSVSGNTIWVDSRVKQLTIDISQNADQNYAYYLGYGTYTLIYCTGAGNLRQMSHTWAGTGVDATLAISVYGAAGTLVGEATWNWCLVTAIYV